MLSAVVKYRLGPFLLASEIPLPELEPLAVGADADQADLTQQPQMLGDARLADRQRVDQVTRRPLTVPKQVKDAAAVGFGDGFKSVHAEKYLIRYITQ